MRFRKPRPLLPMATDSIAMPALCASRSLAVTARSRLVFKPPHRPLSLVTMMKPMALASFFFMNACVYSGFALPRLAAMLRIFSL